MLKKILLISIVLIFSFCQNQKFETDDEFCDYSSCLSQEPFYTELIINFSRPNQCPYPLIFIAKNYVYSIQILDTISTDTVSGFEAYYNTAVNLNYLIIAQYILGSDTIWVMDEHYVYKDSYYICDSLCWEIKNTNFDVKLKNYQK